MRWTEYYCKWIIKWGLEKYKYPYLSIDHLKMGLIRSKNTTLTVEDDEALTKYHLIGKKILKKNI